MKRGNERNSSAPLSAACKAASTNSLVEAYRTVLSAVNKNHAALTEKCVEVGHKEMRMAVYLISYDLDKPGQDYPRVIAELERLGAMKILYSEWILNSTDTAVALRDHLSKFIDGNDMLLVAGLTGEAAWTGLMVPAEKFKQVLAA
ncbi:MAG: hypothetical protein ABSG54_15160 [Terriglobia bacterium]